jgi:hypothetical protein
MSNATQPQYNEVSRKANAGERIKIVNAGYAGEPPAYVNGDIVTATKRDTPSSIYIDRDWVKGGTAWVYDYEYVVLEPIAPTSATLPDLFAQFIRDNAAAVRSYLAEVDPVDSAEEAEPNVNDPQPASLTRAKVIEMARERVAELERVGRSLAARLPQGPFAAEFYRIEFVVNRDKRTVVALVRKRSTTSGKPDAVGIAKCAPDDVFNADIGKAIAAERALGLALTPEFVNAPKPEKAVSGTVVKRKSHPYDDGIRTITRRHETITDGYWFSTGYWDYASTFAIIDDTDAVYAEEESAKGGEAA